MFQNLRLLLFVLSAVPTLASAQSVERIVYASLLDRDGAPVMGLTADELVVRENEIDRDVLARLSAAPERVAVVVLVDTSEDARAMLPDAREALLSFVRAAGGRHDITIVSFGGPGAVLAGYTRDTRVLERAVQRLAPHGGSGGYLLESLMTAAASLRSREDVARIAVVIAAEGRELSLMTSEQVLAEVKRSDIMVEALVVDGLRPHREAPLEQPDVERAAALDGSIKLTGGRRQNLLTSRMLQARLQELATRLNNQYRVVYEAPARQTPPVSIEILTARSDVRARVTGPPRNR